MRRHINSIRYEINPHRNIATTLVVSVVVVNCDKVISYQGPTWYLPGTLSAVESVDYNE